jgi:hypothetical protein
MLTPVTPNPIAQSTTIKSHGSESRTAPGHNPVEAQVASQASGHSTGVGLDAGTILSNVNAEAATAGNRTILQTLALAVAAQLNIVRRNDETMEAFFLRIAAALDDMTPDEQEATELRAGLKLLQIQIPTLSAALKQPDSALAARLSAMAEAPLATPQKTAAATATTTYLQEAPGVSRAAETLAMVTQARSHAESSGIFSSMPADPVPEKLPGDARSLQTQLKSLFEPGVAETRIEIAIREEPANVLILGRTDDDPDEPVAMSIAADMPQAEPAQANAAEQRAGANEETAYEQPAERQPDAQADATPPDVKEADAKPAEARQTDSRLPDTRQWNTRPLDAKLPDTAPGETRPAAGDGTAEARPPNAGVPDARQVDMRPMSSSKTEIPAAAASELPAREPRIPGFPTPQNNNYPSASAQLRAIAQSLVREKAENDPVFANERDGGDQRMQTLLTLKGIAEVITAMPSKAAEFLMSPQLVADIKSKDAKANATLAPVPGDAAVRPETGESFKAEQTIVRKDVATAHQPALTGAPVDDAAQQEARLAADHADAGPKAIAGSVESGSAAIVKAGAASGLDPVPFAFVALQPAKEEFEAEAAEKRKRREDEGEDAGEQEREDPEARRERLARKATDDLLRPEPEVEPELRITRDSSQADRAYALYQRMAGF